MRPEQAFGICLRELRQRQGYSQEQLAMMCDLDRTFISLLERGRRQPSLSTVLNLASALNTAPEDLIRDVRELMDEADPNEGPNHGR